MEASKDYIEPLLQKAEAYGKTSLKIVQLKAAEKRLCLQRHWFPGCYCWLPSLFS